MRAGLINCFFLSYFAGWPGSSERVRTSVSPTLSRSVCGFEGIAPTVGERRDFAIFLSGARAKFKRESGGDVGGAGGTRPSGCCRRRR